ncbi:MAG: outer membrane beta-barrel protein, partial [Bacteroidetes bacterium]|nr:outer membrane beta-barrel protein [Bacteroidota bacterium]
MEKLKIICTLLGFLTVEAVSAQIVVGGEEKKNEEEKKIELVDLDQNENASENYNSLTFHFNRSRTFRSLTVNEGLFGDSLRDRAKEKPLNTWSFGLGYQTKISKSVFFGAGLHLLQNGEQFQLEEQPDTAYSYVMLYRYTAMPLSLEYRYGKAIQLVGTAGIAPSMFLNATKIINATDSNKVETTETIKIKSGSQEYNAFVVSAFVGIGVNIAYSAKWSLYIRPEYRFQINSSYSKTSPYIHKSNAFGVSFGLNYIL